MFFINKQNRINKKTLKGLNAFLILWGTQAFSSLGSSMTNFALIIWSYERLGAHNSAAGSLLLCAVCPVKYLCRSFERPVGQEENHAGVRYAGGFNDPDCMESVKRRAS